MDSLKPVSRPTSSIWLTNATATFSALALSPRWPVSFDAGRVGGGLSPGEGSPLARLTSLPLPQSSTTVAGKRRSLPIIGQDALTRPLVHARGGGSVPLRRRSYCPPLAIVTLILTEAWDIMGAVILLAVLPFFLHHDSEVHATVFSVSCISAVFSLARVSCKGLLKSFADKVGQKHVIMALLIVSVMCHYEMAFHDQPGAILTFRALIGMACAKEMVVTSYIEVHCQDLQWRDHVSCIRARAVMIALCVGSAAGSLMYVFFGWSWLFLALAASNVVELVAVMFILSDAHLSPVMESEQYDIDRGDRQTMIDDLLLVRFQSLLHSELATPLEAKSSMVNVPFMLSGAGGFSFEGVAGALRDPFVCNLLLHSYALLAGACTTLNCLPFLLLSQFKADSAEYGRICLLLVLVLVFCYETRVSEWQLCIFGERGCVLAVCTSAALANAWLLTVVAYDGGLVFATWPFLVVAGFLGVSTKAMHSWLQRISVVSAAGRNQTLDLYYASLPLANVCAAPLAGLMYEFDRRCPFLFALVLYAAAAVSVALAPSKPPRVPSSPGKPQQAAAALDAHRAAQAAKAAEATKQDWGELQADSSSRTLNCALNADAMDLAESDGSDSTLSTP